MRFTLHGSLFVYVYYFWGGSKPHTLFIFACTVAKTPDESAEDGVEEGEDAPSEPESTPEPSATPDGQVFLRGDEAPTGIDPATGTSYTGQNGVQVNGTLTLTEGSVLAAYGGGRNATTSNGGSAVILNGGSITGPGKLIAIGGSAVTGSGTISAANVFAKGGSSYFPKTGSTGGQALAQGVTLAGTSNRSLTDGALRHGGSRLYPGRAGRRLSQNRGCFPRRGLERADAAVRRRAVPGPAQGKAELTPSRQTIPSAWPRTPTRCTRLTP